MSKDGISVFNESMSASGNIFSEGTIDLSGVFTGNIIADNLSVKKNGFISGNVYANELLLADGGKMSGNVYAKKIKVLKNAEIDGDISYCSISIEDGAKIVCKCLCVSEDVIEEKKNTAKDGMFEKQETLKTEI